MENSFARPDLWPLRANNTGFNLISFHFNICFIFILSLSGRDIGYLRVLHIHHHRPSEDRRVQRAEGHAQRQNSPRH